MPVNLDASQSPDKIKYLHERCLHSIQKDGSVSVHHINIQIPAKEMLQIKHGQYHEFVTNIFNQIIEECNFRQNQDCRIPSVNRLYHGSEGASYKSSEIWEIVPLKINDFNSPSSFKKENRNWVPQNYLFTLRKHYMSGVGFLP